MTSLTAQERAFVVFKRGDIRTDALRMWRNGLRKLVNPDTQLPFTEDEIAAATVQGSRWWIEANRDDLLLMASQQRGLYLADQPFPLRASTPFLRGPHREMWKVDPLPAAGGSGTVSCPAAVGSPFIGSTTIPDSGATIFRDQAGLRYQVLFSATATAGGAGSSVDGAIVTVKGIDTGTTTNLAAGTSLEYAANGPLGAAGDPTVATDFRDGAPAETDADYAKRLNDRIGHKPASGNPAHFRHWAREANVSVADAYVYPAAFHANSVLVCVVAKRGDVKGPDGRIPSAGVLTDVTTRLVAPGSPVVPGTPHVLVVLPTKQPANMVMTLDMRRGSVAGWIDATPWPEQLSGVPTTITAVTDQTHFELTIPSGSSALPSGVTAPSLMVWDEATGSLESLEVLSVTSAGGDAYDVVLAQPPSTTLDADFYVMPDNGRRDLIGFAVEAYFDSLGPGEVIDLANDDRSHRAFRYPEPFEEAPQRAGSGVSAFLSDALQASLANETLEFISSTTPAVPADPASGPALMVTGKAAFYAA